LFFIFLFSYFVECLAKKLFGPPTIRPRFDKLPANVQEMRLWFQSHPKLSGPAEDSSPEELQAMYAARKKLGHGSRQGLFG
jgi:hypothetical protein